MNTLPLILMLIAHRADLIAWTVELKSPRAGQCTITATGAGGKDKEAHTVRGADCKRLRRLAEASHQELRSGVTARRPGSPITDEPQYKLKLGDKTVPVPFEAPADCELSEDGSENCVNNELSASQKLLLELRAFAQSFRPRR